MWRGALTRDLERGGCHRRSVGTQGHLCGAQSHGDTWRSSTTACDIQIRAQIGCVCVCVCGGGGGGGVHAWSHFGLCSGSQLTSQNLRWPSSAAVASTPPSGERERSHTVCRRCGGGGKRKGEKESKKRREGRRKEEGGRKTEWKEKRGGGEGDGISLKQL